MRIEKELVDARAIVKDVSESMRPLALSKGINYNVTLHDEALFMNGDAMRLQQVVTNLLQNAIKFTAAGGSVGIEIRYGGDSASIIVHDSGVGIAPEFLPNIFDRFSQADASTRRTYAGLGLGLTIVSTIVELHGGRISVKSEGLNKGAEFVVTLPLAEEFYRNGEPAPASAGVRGTKLDGVRILLVDDDMESLIPLQIFLERQGARVTCEGGAADALNRLAADEFDVLVSDIGMPEIDGYELVRRVRMLNGKNSAVAAIAVTAFAAPEHRVQAFAAGFNAHISKPMDFEELLATIRKTHEQKS
jgi:CheY-like chemotaxis protein